MNFFLKNSATWSFMDYIVISFCLKKLIKLPFFYKNDDFSYMLAMGYLAPGEIFENMFQLMRFGVYFDIILKKMAILI